MPYGCRTSTRAYMCSASAQAWAAPAHSANAALAVIEVPSCLIATQRKGSLPVTLPLSGQCRQPHVSPLSGHVHAPATGRHSAMRMIQVASGGARADTAGALACPGPHWQVPTE
jgi:hypothetical protein